MWQEYPGETRDKRYTLEIRIIPRVTGNTTY